MANSIYCSATHLKCLVGEADNRLFRIRDYGEVPLPSGGMINGIITDEATICQFLRDLGVSRGLVKGSTWLVIDSSNIQARRLDVPAQPDARILEFIRQEFGQYSDAATDNIYDFTVLDPKASSGGVTILAVSVSRTMIETYRRVFMQAGYDFKGINIGINCQVKLAGLLPELKKTTFALALLDGRSLSLTLFENGAYRITNKYRLMQTENTQEWLHEIGGHFSSMIQFNTGQRLGTEIAAIYFAGFSDEQTAALRASLTYLDVAMHPFDISAHLRLSGQAASSKEAFDAGKYLLNIGNMIKIR